MRPLALLLVCAACGGTSAPPVVQGPPAAMIATGAPDDVIVAQVAGRPVWGSCIAMQVKLTPTKTKQAALDECVSFELLAQAAEQRGLDRHGETVEATRTAIVARLVDQFAARTSLDAVKSQIDELYKPTTFTVPEKRESWNALIKADDKSSDADHVAARALAEKLHDALKNETGLLPVHFQDTAKRITAGSKLALDLGVYRPIPADHENTLPEYRGALFAIPEIGRVSPVVKSVFGYHVILWSAVAPAVTLDRQAAGPIIHGNLQRRLFDQFLAEIVSSSGIKTTVYTDVLEKLENKERP